MVYMYNLIPGIISKLNDSPYPFFSKHAQTFIAPSYPPIKRPNTSPISLTINDEYHESVQQEHKSSTL